MAPSTIEIMMDAIVIMRTTITQLTGLEISGQLMGIYLPIAGLGSALTLDFLNALRNKTNQQVAERGHENDGHPVDHAPLEVYFFHGPNRP